MREDNLKLLDRWLKSMAAADFDAARPLMADDVSLHMTGRSPFSGAYWGKDSAVDVLQEMYDVCGGTDEFLGVVDKMASDEHAFARVRKRMSCDGRTLQYTRDEFYTIRGGKIAEAWLTDDEQYDVDQLLGHAAQLVVP